MTDIEERLTAALRDVAADAPPAAGLAGAARERQASRRRTTVLTSAAAVAAVVAVVGGVAMLGSSGDGGRPPFADDATPTVTPTTPPGRVETWRDLSVTVPTGWGYGSLSTWCLDGATEPGTPVVERPGGVTELILCSRPASGYGVQFIDAHDFDALKPHHQVWQYEAGDPQLYPDGAWLGWERAGAVVQVVAPSKVEAEAVLGSVTRLGYEQADANGCTPVEYVQGVMWADKGSVQLCRYDIDGRLEQSELLTGQDAADVVEALADAPTGGDQMCTQLVTGPVIRVTSDQADGRVTLDACQGLIWDGQHHDLTSDVLYWTLSPGWSGGVEGDVPMPDQLRQ